MKLKMTIDDALKPMDMTCGDCGATMTAYPDSGNGKGYCPKCSPAWLKSFAIHCMNQERIKHNLQPIN